MTVDVLIVGGGPAGLAVALTIARQLHTAVVFDSGSYRNRASTHIHTVPTWDHKDPADFRAAARKNILEGYETISFEDVEIATVKQVQPGNYFEAIDAHGKVWTGRKLVLATGVVDEYPDIDGYAECWVKGIFHCLFCHGYEERHAASSGVLAIGDLANAMPALHFARFALQLTPNKTTIYTNGSEELASTLRSRIESSNVASTMHVDARPITRLEKAAEGAAVTVHFGDGSAPATEGFLGHKPRCVLQGKLVQQLGLATTPSGDLQVSPPFYQTSLRGVFAAGDGVGPIKIANHALFTGAAVGSGVAAQLQAETMGMESMF